MCLSFIIKIVSSTFTSVQYYFYGNPGISFYNFVKIELKVFPLFLLNLLYVFLDFVFFLPGIFQVHLIAFYLADPKSVQNDKIAGLQICIVRKPLGFDVTGSQSGGGSDRFRSLFERGKDTE